MALPFSKFTEQFFWDFKKMDNVNYNFEIMEILYKSKRQNFDDELFNKPIIIQIVSIIECCLYDFTQRIKGRTADPLPNVKIPLELYFKNIPETDVLRKLIVRIESQNLFGVETKDTLYKDLDFLRKVRNRIHIQNKNRELNYNMANERFKDEHLVFQDTTLELAQNCLERIIEILSNRHPRWNKPPLPMSQFPRPWN